VGMYFGPCDACSKNVSDPKQDYFSAPKIRYDYELTQLALNMTIVGGATAYQSQTPPWLCTAPVDPQTGICPAVVPCTGAQCVVNCTDTNFIDSNYRFGLDRRSPTTNGLPFGVDGTDRFCALWKAYSEKPQKITHIDRTQEVCLSQPICPPAAAGNPFGYVLPRVPETTPTAALFPTVQNVVYRGFGDGHVHRLWRIP